MSASREYQLMETILRAFEITRNGATLQSPEIVHGLLVKHGFPIGMRKVKHVHHVLEYLVRSPWMSDEKLTAAGAQSLVARQLYARIALRIHQGRKFPGSQKPVLRAIWAEQKALFPKPPRSRRPYRGRRYPMK